MKFSEKNLLISGPTRVRGPGSDPQIYPSENLRVGPGSDPGRTRVGPQILQKKYSLWVKRWDGPEARAPAG